MTAAFEHISAATLMGSWPYIPEYVTGAPSLVSGALKNAAIILGVQRETAAGFDVESRAFLLWIDGDVAGRSIAFPAGGPYTLDQIITEINSDAGVEVAFRDNGFLKLVSPTEGPSSYLRLETDSAAPANFEVFHRLGLFAETISRGGDILGPSNIEPDRQVSLPGQLSMAKGENITAEVFNRTAFQLAVNSDRAAGVLYDKRIAIQKSWEGTYTSPGGANEGVVIAGAMYTGDITSPTPAELERIVAVLDVDGNEFTRKEREVLGADPADTNTDFTVNPETDEVHVAPSAAIFALDDDTNDIYVVATNLTGGNAVYNDQLLKIIRVLSTSEVVVSVVDSTGHETQISELGRTIQRVRVHTKKVIVEGLFEDNTAAQDVTNWQEEKYSSLDVVRVDLNNRIVCDSMSPPDFLSDVVPGDSVEWSSHGSTAPYLNNGTYRVKRVVDDHTLELVSDSWGPVYLNPDLNPGGSATVKLDGKFRPDVFLKFKDSPDGAIPESGVDTIRVVYMGMSTFDTATDDPAVFSPSIQYQQEADYATQRAILTMMGPSAVTFDQWILDNPNVNLEGLYHGLDDEHYGFDSDYYGRHQTIRPDTVNFWPEDVTGDPQVILRDFAGEEATPVPKFVLRNFADNHSRFILDSLGHVLVDAFYHQAMPNNSYGILTGSSARYVAEMPIPTSAPSSAVVQDGTVFDLMEGNYAYRYAAIDGDGTAGEPGPTTSVLTINHTFPNNSIQLTLTAQPGAIGYRIWRQFNSDAWHYKDILSMADGRLLDHGGVVWTWDTIPTTHDAMSLQLDPKSTGSASSWVPSDLFSIGGAAPSHSLNIKSTTGDYFVAYRPNWNSVWSTAGHLSTGVRSELGESASLSPIDLTEYMRFDGVGQSWDSKFRREIFNNRVTWEDENDNTLFYFYTNETDKEGWLGIGAEEPTGDKDPQAPFHIRKNDYGDFLWLSNIAQTPREVVKTGISSNGNWYFTSAGTSPHNFLIRNQGNHYVFGAASVFDAQTGGAFNFDFRASSGDQAASFNTTGSGILYGPWMHFYMTDTSASVIPDGYYVGQLGWHSSYSSGIHRNIYQGNAFIRILKSVTGSSGTGDTGGAMLFGTCEASVYTPSTRFVIDHDGEMFFHDGGLNLRGWTNTVTRDESHGLKYYSSFDGISIDGPALFGNTGGALGTRAGGPGNEHAVAWWDDEDLHVRGAVFTGGPADQIKTLEGVSAGPTPESTVSILRQNVHDLWYTNLDIGGTEDVEALAFDGDTIYAIGNDTSASLFGISVSRLTVDSAGGLSVDTVMGYVNKRWGTSLQVTGAIKAGGYIYVAHIIGTYIRVTKLRINAAGLPTCVPTDSDYWDSGYTTYSAIPGIHFDGNYIYVAGIDLTNDNIRVWKINPQLGSDAVPTTQNTMSFACAANEECANQAKHRLAAGKNYLLLATHLNNTDPLDDDIRLHAVSANFRSSSIMSHVVSITAALSDKYYNSDNNYAICADGRDVWLCYERPSADSFNWGIKRFRQDSVLNLYRELDYTRNLGDPIGGAVDEKYIYFFGTAGGMAFDKHTLEVTDNFATGSLLYERYWTGEVPFVDGNSIFTFDTGHDTIYRFWKAG